MNGNNERKVMSGPRNLRSSIRQCIVFFTSIPLFLLGLLVVDEDNNHDNNSYRNDDENAYE
jgi:hypothetical protein